MDPLTAIYLGTTLASGIGSLFGSKENELNPETKRTIEMLRKRYSQGIDPKILMQMRQRLKGSIGNQALSDISSMRGSLARQGLADSAVENVARGKIGSQRMQAIGEGMAGIDIANEEMKLNALKELSSLTGNLPLINRGEGYQQLFGAGVSGLMTLLDRRKRKSDDWWAGGNPTGIYGGYA